MKATFENSVNVLVKAYLDDTLELSNCRACAVGNLVAHANGEKFVRSSYGLTWESNNFSDWFMACYPDHPGSRIKMAQQIESIGYTEEHVIKIENAFERSYRNSFKLSPDETDTFDGLMAVVDILADIHGIDLKAKEEAKLLFVKA